MSDKTSGIRNGDLSHGQRSGRGSINDSGKSPEVRTGKLGTEYFPIPRTKAMWHSGKPLLCPSNYPVEASHELDRIFGIEEMTYPTSLPEVGGIPIGSGVNPSDK